MAGPYTFAYTGAAQTFRVPRGVTKLHIEAHGAQGGGQGAFGSPGTNGSDAVGGLGGHVSCDLPVTPGETLTLYVGGAGSVVAGATPGGYNGGGTGSYSGSGGGATDIRRGGTALANRILVAGGGGGQTTGAGGFGANDRTGPGGGTTGGAGSAYGGIGGGSGGTQAAGGTGGTGGSANGADGALGQGGNGATTSWSNGGGGGGGYYGGGGGAGTSGAGNGGAGGGGSNYVDGSATSVTHEQGVRSGDGLLVITAIGEDHGLLFVDDFADLSHWSAGSFSINPAGCAYHAGDGSGTGGASRAMSTGAKYVEALVYGDATGGDSWGIVKLDNAGGAAYDANGVGFAFRSAAYTDNSKGAVFPHLASGAVLEWAVPDWTLPGSEYQIATPPRSLATAILLGIHRVATGKYDFYLNRRRMARYNSVPNTIGPNLYFAAFNGNGTHIDYVAEADRPLTIYDDIRVPSKMSY